MLLIEISVKDNAKMEVNMKKMRKVIGLLLVLTLLISFVTACGKNGESTPETSDKTKVALILPGKKDDVSFNQAMFIALDNYAKEHKDTIDLQVVENMYEVADIEPALIDFASQDYDVIFGHGFQFMEPIVKIAPQYKDSCFLLGTGYKSVDNSGVYDIHLQAGGYLMGVVAALATETDKIGVVGGADASEIFRGHEGFKAGAKSINPDIQIQEVYTGDWTDTAGAKEAAVGMYDSGVDVVWHSGDGIGLGVVQAAKEKDKICLGNVADQNELAPDNVMTGVVYNWVAVIEDIMNDINQGQFKGREEGDRFYWITIENGGILYAPIVDPKGMLTEEDKDKIEEVYQGIKNGSIVMPEVDEPGS